MVLEIPFPLRIASKVKIGGDLGYRIFTGTACFSRSPGVMTTMPIYYQSDPS